MSSCNWEHLKAIYKNSEFFMQSFFYSQTLHEDSQEKWEAFYKVTMVIVFNILIFFHMDVFAI